MSPVQLLAAGATTFGLASALTLALQTRALRRARQACEISVAMLAVWAVGYSVWVAYGLALANPVLVAVNLAGAIGTAATLVVAVRLRRAYPCRVPRGALPDANRGFLPAR
jgi:uncharacterized protein with PQ loop repeat